MLLSCCKINELDSTILSERIPFDQSVVSSSNCTPGTVSIPCVMNLSDVNSVSASVVMLWGSGPQESA